MPCLDVVYLPRLTLPRWPRSSWSVAARDEACCPATGRPGSPYYVPCQFFQNGTPRGQKVWNHTATSLSETSIGSQNSSSTIGYRRRVERGGEGFAASRHVIGTPSVPSYIVVEGSGDKTCTYTRIFWFVSSWAACRSIVNTKGAVARRTILFPRAVELRAES